MYSTLRGSFRVPLYIYRLAFFKQTPGFAESSSDAHHGPAAASVRGLHPCAGRAVWPLSCEGDRYRAEATGTGKPQI